MTLRTLLFGALVLGLWAAPTRASSTAVQDAADTPLKVLATVPTYGTLVSVMGGDLVDVVTFCRPGQDIHGVQATPSIMARARHADMLFYTGLDSENWLPSLLRSSGNAHLLPGSSDHSVAMTDGLSIKEVPAVLSRASGDMHAYGNTHVWTDPYAVRTMAGRVKDALIAALPGHAEEIRARHKVFHDRLTKSLVRWLTEFRSIPAAERVVVVYHRSWIYLLDRLGITRLDTLEPKVRVAPTPSHLAEVIDEMNARKVKVIIREPYQFADAADFVAEATGAQVLLLATHPGYPEGVDDIIDHFEHNISALHMALLGESVDD